MGEPYPPVFHRLATV